MSALVIDCSDCLRERTDACNDCIVSFLLDREEGAIVFDVEQERAIRTLRDGGLLPGVRLERKIG